MALAETLLDLRERRIKRSLTTRVDAVRGLVLCGSLCRARLCHDYSFC